MRLAMNGSYYPPSNQMPVASDTTLVVGQYSNENWIKLIRVATFSGVPRMPR